MSPRERGWDCTIFRSILHTLLSSRLLFRKCLESSWRKFPIWSKPYCYFFFENSWPLSYSDPFTHGLLLGQSGTNRTFQHFLFKTKVLVKGSSCAWLLHSILSLRALLLKAWVQVQGLPLTEVATLDSYLRLPLFFSPDFKWGWFNLILHLQCGSIVWVIGNNWNRVRIW